MKIFSMVSMHFKEIIAILAAMNITDLIRDTSRDQIRKKDHSGATLARNPLCQGIWSPWSH